MAMRLVWPLLILALTACGGASSADYSQQGQSALAQATTAAANARLAMTREALPIQQATQWAYWQTATALAVPTATSTPQPTIAPAPTATATPEPTQTATATPVAVVERVIVPTVVVYVTVNAPTVAVSGDSQVDTMGLYVAAVIATLLIIGGAVLAWLFLRPKTIILPGQHRHGGKS